MPQNPPGPRGGAGGRKVASFVSTCPPLAQIYAPRWPLARQAALWFVPKSELPEHRK
jgi:hypothetical protein